MQTTLSKAIIFVAGVAVGAASAWAILKSYYKKIADEEIASVKETFAQKTNDISEEEVEPMNDEEERTAYASTIVKEGYISCNPYIIAPDEFEGIDDYQSISLTYYADGVLTDDVDNIIPDAEIEDTVGRDALERFGEYDDYSVFVRNDELRIDYEIVRDTRTFADVCEEYGLHQTEG